MDGRFEPIIIRYDGLDADNHTIDLAALGKSLEGAARLIGVAANFVVTGQYVRKMPALSVRVLAARPEAHCYEIPALIMTLSGQAPLPLVKEMGSKAVEYIVNYILAQFGGRQDQVDKMVHLIERALEEHGATARAALDSNVAIVRELAAAQRPAARLLVSPVGETCEFVRVGDLSNDAIRVDSRMKEAIMAPEPAAISSTKLYSTLISELDMQTGSCRLQLADNDEPDRRIIAEISDPVVRLPNNPYVAAMKEQRWLTVSAKAEIRNGDIDKLYILDCAAGGGGAHHG